MTTQTSKTLLLATDQQNSVLNELDANRLRPAAYTPYGHRPRGNGLLSLLGFNGEPPDPVTGHYHLGNGYRQFNPVLMRFNSPDSWSPFGEGGMNAFVFCLGDPINRVELDGHKSGFFLSVWKGFRNRIGIRTPSKFDNLKQKVKKNQPQTSVGARKEPLHSPTAKPVHHSVITDSKHPVINNNPNTYASGNQAKAVPPITEQTASALTKNKLMHRRTKSTDHIPSTFNLNFEAFYANSHYEPDGGFLMTMFAGNPNGNHARLYVAMGTEQRRTSSQIQRAIRTGGFR